VRRVFDWLRHASLTFWRASVIVECLVFVGVGVPLWMAAHEGRERVPRRVRQERLTGLGLAALGCDELASEALLCTLAQAPDPYNPRETTARDTTRVPPVLQVLLPEGLMFRVTRHMGTFASFAGGRVLLPTYDIDGAREIRQVQFPGSDEERATEQWIEQWQEASDYRHLFWYSRGRPFVRTARPRPELPPDSLTDRRLAEVWGERCLWLEKNMPYATTMIGYSEYRSHTFCTLNPESHLTTYHVQIHIRPRRFARDLR
jgi:hypothetical protein